MELHNSIHAAPWFAFWSAIRFVELHILHHQAPLSVMELHDWSLHGAPHLIMLFRDYEILSPLVLHMITQS